MAESASLLEQFGMSIEIKFLGSKEESEYSQLLAGSPAAMFNHSLLYGDFLSRVTVPSERHYLLGYESGELAAALPLFVKDGPAGPVVNSLPFYGSHGGLVAKPTAGMAVKRGLMEAFQDFCIMRGTLSATIIESPFARYADLYLDGQPAYLDERIGQITSLPEPLSSDEDIEGELLELYHQKTRNMVRKGMKSGFSISHSGTNEVMQALYRIHQENILAVGGMPKPWCIFEAIGKLFVYDEHYRIYFAECADGIVSLLLVFYFNQTVEYFTPATLESYRSRQPLSLLIFTAMRDAILERGARYWNWGGTWLDQDGVYLFKSRWGTRDHRYRYYTYVDQKKRELLKAYTQADLLDNYSYFYTLPFKELLS